MTSRIALIVCCVLLAACGKDSAPAAAGDDAAAAQETRSLLDQLLGSDDAASGIEVVELQLGTQADENGLVEDDRESFGPQDTIVASAILKGTTSGAALRAEWRREDGQVLSVNEQKVGADGPQLARFAISPKDRWDAGVYTLVLLSGKTELASREFRVE